MKTTKVMVVGAMLMMLVWNAQAATFNYACKYQGDSRQDHRGLFAAKLDTTKKTITWRGSVYENMKEIPVGTRADDCAKDCYLATRRDGATAGLDTATQGYADLTAVVGTAPLNDGVDQVDCKLVNNR